MKRELSSIGNIKINEDESREDTTNNASNIVDPTNSLPITHFSIAGVKRVESFEA